MSGVHTYYEAGGFGGHVQGHAVLLGAETPELSDEECGFLWSAADCMTPCINASYRFSCCFGGFIVHVLQSVEKAGSEILLVKEISRGVNLKPMN